jgi:uncharacterized protein (TIGR03435 family)
MITALTNHLWQSTIFAIVAGLLTLAFRQNRAKVRYWLWFSASLKFFVPFSLLISLGSHLQPTPAAPKAAPALSVALEQVTEPFPETASFAPSDPARTRDWIPVAIFSVWACGVASLALIRLRSWLRIRAAVRASAPLDICAPVEVRSSPGLLEPGVVGFLKPVLLVPAGIAEHLTPRQMEAVLAHELCHIRRRDNLTSAAHMIVEATFWFHPLVWWIGARLLEERERACDEEVLSLGGEPRVYAEAILNVCKLYVESPLVCVSGVTGADLKKRIEAIMLNRMATKMMFGKKAVLTVAALAAVGLPVSVGMINAPVAIVATTAMTATPGTAAASPTPQEPNSGSANHFIEALGAVTATTVTIKPQVDGQLLSVNFKEGDLVKAGQLLASIDPRPYQLRLAAAESPLTQDEAQLADFRRNKDSLPAAQFETNIAQLEARVKADQANVDNAKLQLKYAQIASPITGVAGLLMVDPGNIVRAADSIVVINQLQPIAVVFTIPEDRLPQILPRLSQGANLPVEVWSRDQKVKIATSRLTAVDNQIDAATGMAKLKATFDNSNGALFPNQFVNVRLFVTAAQSPRVAVQPPAPTVPAFEVASVKPCGSGEPGGTAKGGGRSGGAPGGQGPSPDRLNLACQPVRNLIRMAYITFNNGQRIGLGLPPPIEGGPAWIDSERYKIEAKAEGSPGQEMMRGPMLQALLEDRFKLRVHHEDREVPVYTLTVAKSGPKMPVFQEGTCAAIDFSRPPVDAAILCGLAMRKSTGQTVKWEVHGATLDDLARALGADLDRIVINKTGLSGKFDYHLEFAIDETTAGLNRLRAGPNAEPAFPMPADPSGGLSIFTAIQQQLGLKLESAKGPRGFLVIDHVEKPTEN